MPYLGSQIRDFALFTFVPEQKLCTRWMHSRLHFLVRWCLVPHWWRRRARGSRQRRHLVVIVFLCLRWWWRHSGRVARNSGLKLCFERRWRCWISRSLGSTGSWWFVVVAFRPVSVVVSCSFSAGEGLAATSANGGASEVPLWLRVPGNWGRKVPPMASVDTRGQKPPFFASPQYVSVLEPGQNIKNNRGQKPLLH